MGVAFTPGSGRIRNPDAVKGPTEWDAYLAETSASTNVPQWHLEGLIYESAEAENLQWERLDEIRRLGT